MSRWRDEQRYTWEDHEGNRWEWNESDNYWKERVYRHSRNLDNDLEEFLGDDEYEDEETPKKLTIEDLNVDDSKLRADLIREYLYQLESLVFEEIEDRFQRDYDYDMKKMERQISQLKDEKASQFAELQVQNKEIEKLKKKNQSYYDTAVKAVAKLKAFIKAAAAFNISFRKLEDEVAKQNRLQKNILECLTLFGMEQTEFQMIDISDQLDDDDDEDESKYGLDTNTCEDQHSNATEESEVDEYGYDLEELDEL